MNIELKHGDCLEVLKTIPDNSVDSIVTDPPYHLTSIVKRFGKEGSAPAQFGTDGAFSRASKGFMGKEWDGGDIAQRPDVWIECLRVLKPGGHMVAFSGSRTYHRMAVAIEDAGFEIRDQIMWIYGSGFPKSHNIGKAVDKIMGNDREEYETENTRDRTNHNANTIFTGQDVKGWKDSKGQSEWEGWGTALKPAHEPIVVARKPLSEKSVAENVLKWGTGGINIDGSRVGTEQIKSYQTEKNVFNPDYEIKATKDFTISEGRWPANIILDEEAGQILDEQSGVSGTGKKKVGKDRRAFFHEQNQIFSGGTKTSQRIEDYGDKGGASRFFYCPKASKKDREDINNHPTVKPTDLMLYLIKLVTPVGGMVMDCFLGSGSTGKAAVRGGFDFIGIEREEEYLNIAKARIENESSTD